MEDKEMATEEWKEIDWAKVGKKKVIFLYQEAANTKPFRI